MLKIKAECTQLGLAVEASNDGGNTWQSVQVTSYKVRNTRSVLQYGTAIDPAADRAEYLAEIRGRGIQFVEVE